MPVLQVPCPSDTIPSAEFKTQIKDMYSQLGSMPARLALAGECALAASIRQILDGIESAMGIFPLGFADFGSLKIPEIEWEGRIEALLSEFKLYVQTKMLELIATLIPVNFTINILGLSIDLSKLFTEPGYTASLIAQIRNNLSSFLSLIPDTLRRIWNADLGLSCPDITAAKIWKYIMDELKDGAYKLLVDRFAELINVFESIWDALGLPALPAIMEFDWNAMVEGVTGAIRAQIESIEAQIKALANIPGMFDPGALGDQLMQLRAQLYQDFIDALSNVSIFGISLGGILDIDLQKILNQSIGNLNRTMEEIIGAIHSFTMEWPQYISLEVWMDQVKAFFDDIGIGAIMDWVTFSVCDFLTTVVNIPLAVTVPTLGVITEFPENPC